MGERISDVDCTAFGILGLIYWGSPSTDHGHALLNSAYNPSLKYRYLHVLLIFVSLHSNVGCLISRNR